MRLVGFLRCDCGKIHTLGGISPTSKCKCGEWLWDVLVQAAYDDKPTRPKPSTRRHRN